MVCSLSGRIVEGDPEWHQPVVGVFLKTLRRAVFMRNNFRLAQGLF